MARPMPQRMQSSRRNVGGGGGGNRYADEEYSTSQYSGGEYYEDEYYEDDMYDDDGGYDDYDDDDYDNNDARNFRRSSGGAAARNNYGGGGGRHRNKAASFHDRRSSDNYDYDDNRGGGHNRRGSGGGGRGGGRQQQHHRRSNSANDARRQESSLHMLPGTPKQAQDIIRKYTLGMALQSFNHMALPPTSPPPGPAREIATLTVANLLPKEYAFVRRSNGQWTFAQVAVKHEQLGQLVFIVNKQGSTKSFKRMEWSGFVRRIKGTERKVTLPPQITASGEQQQQQQQQQSRNQDNNADDQRASPLLAIGNGPSTHNNNNNNNNNRSSNPSSTPGNNNNKLPDISQMSIKEMKLELTSHNINYESFMDKSEFRNAIIDARAEAVKNALIKEQQQMQEKNLQQQQERLQSNFDGFGNYKDPYDDVPGDINNSSNNNNKNNGNGNNNNNGDEAVPISTLDADLSNLAGQTITLQPMNDDEVSELMGDYLLTEYKFQMKVLEKERQKKQQGNNKLGSITEGGGGAGGGDQSLNIEAEDGGGGGQHQTHYEKQAFAKSQKWGSLGDSNV